jgi:thymidylate kinase
MKIVPVYLWKHLPSADDKDERERPAAKKIADPKTQFSHLQEQDSRFVDRIASESRVLIVEGISGSGKDTFQAYLKKKLKGRDVYDYSEGDVLHSWKQLQIEGIFELRIKFMKLFVNYVRDVVSRDENAVFLLNRFHLSTCGQQPKLGREYDETINVLRMLPVHIFILQLDENEFERRSMHPERSGAWQKFQQQIAAKDSFRDRLERQQRTILETAKRQQIPYSIIKLADEFEIGDRQVRMSRAGVRMNATEISRKKRDLPRTL